MIDTTTDMLGSVKPYRRQVRLLYVIIMYLSDNI